MSMARIPRSCSKLSHITSPFAGEEEDNAEDIVHHEEATEATTISSDINCSSYSVITPLALSDPQVERYSVLEHENLTPMSHVNVSKKKAVLDYTQVDDGPRCPLIRPHWPIQPTKGNIGGRLAQYSANWRYITSNKWVLYTVEHGLTWEWINDLPPTLSRVPFEIGKRNTNLDQVYREAIAKDLREGIIEVTKDPGSLGFYNLYWLKLKPDTDENGKPKYRRLLDLSKLNLSIDKSKFKMETAETVREAISPGDYTCSIDYTDAYFHIKINEEFKKYLRFVHEDVVYNLCVMPQGINIAPWVFTAIVKPIKQFCHLRGIQVYQYIDDWLVKHKRKEIAKQHTDFVIHIGEACGFVKSEKKCDLQPKQVFEFLGYMFDTVQYIVYPPDKRWVTINPLIDEFLRARTIRAHKWQILIGKFVALTKLVPLGMIHVRELQFHLHNHWRVAWERNTKRIPIPSYIKKEILWWGNKQYLQTGVPIVGKLADVLLYTDASDFGYGGHIAKYTFKGLWNSDELEMHINAKELLAVFYALRYFIHLIADTHVLVMTDNTTVIAYINKQGGTKSRTLWSITLDMYGWMRRHRIIISAKHIPGRMNLLADQLSRDMKVNNLEWSLNSIVVEKLWNLWGQPDIDLFANWMNTKCAYYMSYIFDDEAYCVNAFTTSWNDMFAYAFPPFVLIDKVIAKFKEEGDRLILIAPLNPERAWYPTLLSLLAKPPVKLPYMSDLLIQSDHMLNNRYNLHAWYLSTRVNELTEYRSSLHRDYVYSKIGYVEGKSILSYTIRK